MRKRNSVSVIAILLMLLTGCNDGKTKDILYVVKEVKVEYGEDIPKKTKAFIDISKVTKEEQDEVLKNATVDYSKVKYEKEKSIPSIGEYEVIVTYKEEEKKVKLKVQDTTAPAVREIEYIQMVQGTDLSTYDFNRLIEAEDLSEMKEPVFITKNIDVNIPGEYAMTIQVQDIYDNKVEQEVKVIVLEKVSDDKAIREEVTTNADGEVIVVIHVEDSDGSQTSDTNSNDGPTSNGNEETPTNQGSSTSTLTPAPPPQPSQQPTPEQTPQPTPEPEVHKHTREDIVSAWFSSESEAMNWADSYIDTQPVGEYIYSGYAVVYCSCGMFGISFY